MPKSEDKSWRANWPLERPRRGLSLVNRAETEAELADLHRSVYAAVLLVSRHGRMRRWRGTVFRQPFGPTGGQGSSETSHDARA